jgi:mannosyl-oligosaccharide glucosidase
MKRASSILEPLQESSSTAVPDPAFVLQLADEVYFGSNLFAVQKTFDGPFQFDVFFESASAKQILSCESLIRIR